MKYSIFAYCIFFVFSMDFSHADEFHNYNGYLSNKPTEYISSKDRIAVLMDIGSAVKSKIIEEGKGPKDIEDLVTGSISKSFGIDSKLFIRDNSESENETYFRFLTIKGFYNDPILDQKFFKISEMKVVTARFAELYIHFIRDIDTNMKLLNDCAKEHSDLAQELDRGARSREHSELMRSKVKRTNQKCDAVMKYYTKENFALAKRMINK